MAAVVASISVAMFGVAGYWLGIFDRPPFLYQEHLLSDASRELVVIVAVTREKGIATHIGRLLMGVLQAIQSTSQGKAMLKASVARYDHHSAASRLGVGLYLDNPTAHLHPRWASGFAVEADQMTFAEYQEWAASLQAASGLPESIRAVRIGGEQVSLLKATVPWRHYWTPHIAPFLHWSRLHGYIERGGADGRPYTADNGRGVPSNEGPVCLEIYACENEVKASGGYIDYVVLFGNTQRTWDDAFPVDSK